MAHKINRLVILTLGLWLATAGLWQPLADAAAGGKSPAYSRPTGSPRQNVWGSRSGGGSYGYSKPAPPSPGGYARPAAPAPGGYTKPSPPTPGGYATPATPAPGGYTKPITPAPGGYTKPATGQTGPRATTYTKPDGIKPPATTGGYVKPGQSQAPVADPAKAARVANTKASAPIGSKFDAELVQRMQRQRAAESLKAYQGEQQKFKQPVALPSQGQVVGNPVYQKAQTYSKFDYGNYYTRRDNYYGGTGWSPPAYAYGSSPSFGVWDAMMWWMILDKVGNRQYTSAAYHHAEDPGYRQWRQEADRLAQNNQELKEKLAKLDAEVKQQEAEGLARDAAYLPPGMPPEVALASSVMAKKEPQKPKLRFATGQKGGNYDKFSQLLQREAAKLNIEVELIATAGAMENLQKLLGNNADAALVQSDVLALKQKKFPGQSLISEQAPMYRETVQLVANRGSGIKSIKDLDPQKHVIFIGPEDSGTAITWEGLCQQDQSYGKIPVKHADYATALKEVETNPNALMMLVSGFRSDFLEQAEKFAKETGKLRLVTLDDWDFNDKRDENGNSIYHFVKIPSKTYPSLQKGWFWGRDVETLAVMAVLVLRNDWVKQYDANALDALSLAVARAGGEIYRQVDGLK
jgi:TRAP transporter TAXI family solute receptor